MTACLAVQHVEPRSPRAVSRTITRCGLNPITSTNVAVFDSKILTIEIGTHHPDEGNALGMDRRAAQGWGVDVLPNQG